MDFGSESIRTESITEKKETTFRMDSVVGHGGKAIIGDAMGCGKRIHAIAVMQH